jgi:hypothetical protein
VRQPEYEQQNAKIVGSRFVQHFKSNFHILVIGKFAHTRTRNKQIPLRKEKLAAKYKTTKQEELN